MAEFEDLAAPRRSLGSALACLIRGALRWTGMAFLTAGFAAAVWLTPVAGPPAEEALRDAPNDCPEADAEATPPRTCSPRP